MRLHLDASAIIYGVEAKPPVGNLAHDHEGLAPDEFRVDFMLQWFPSPSEGSNEAGE